MQFFGQFQKDTMPALRTPYRYEKLFRLFVSNSILFPLAF
jgi:hypothetical protein